MKSESRAHGPRDVPPDARAGAIISPDGARRVRRLLIYPVAIQQRRTRGTAQHAPGIVAREYAIGK